MKIIIIHYLPHYTIGGIQTYVRNLFHVFKDHEIIEVCFFNDKTNIAQKNKGVKTMILNDKNFFIEKGSFWKKKNKEVMKIIDKVKPDIIINNTINYFSTKKAFLKKTNIINVQHQSLRSYKWYKIGSINRIINSFLGFAYWRKNINSKNVIFFIKSKKKKKKNHFAINLPMPYDFNFNQQKKVGKKIVWVGRFYEPVKGLKYLNCIYLKSNFRNKFNIIGQGRDKNKIIINKNQIQTMNQQQVLEELKRSKVFILTSKSEGFPNVLVEALSNGIPSIIFDSFETASFFKNCPGVFIVKKYNINKYNQIIDKIMKMTDKEWLSLSKQITNWAFANFNFIKFEKKWNKIVEKIVENKLDQLK